MEETKFDKNDRTSLPISVKITAFCIVLSELCERLAYYSAMENMILFTTSTLEMTSYEATSAKLIITGTVFIVPVFFAGIVADSIAGKYNTILGAGFIYLFGLFLLPLSAADYTQWYDGDDGEAYDLKVNVRKLYYFMGLTFVAIGTGGIKTNVGPFGAQQVEKYGDDKVKSFFNWFYFAINVGGTIAFLGVAYIQQNISFMIGYSVPFFSMILAVLALLLIKHRCVNKSLSGNILVDLIKMCIDTRCGRRKTDELGNMRKDEKKEKYKELIQGLKAVLLTLPLFLIHSLFSLSYVQSQTINTLQGLRMDVSVGSFKTPVAALGIVNTVVVLLLIPFVDKILYPLMDRKGYKPTQLQRMGFGYILNSISCVVCGVVEIYRKDYIDKDGILIQNLSGKDFQASSLSVYWQIPQTAILAASEIFSNITAIELAFSKAPDSMKGLVMSIYLITFGFGSYLAQGILKIIEAGTGTQPPDAWLPDEFNQGKGEYIYFVDAGVVLVALILLIVYAKLTNKEGQTSDVTGDTDIHEKNNVDTNVADLNDSNAMLVKYTETNDLYI